MSYRGTETAETRDIADSSRHHSVLLIEYKPMCSPGCRPMARSPEERAARASCTSLYVIHWYS